MPVHDELVLSLLRMNAVEDLASRLKNRIRVASREFLGGEHLWTILVVNNKFGSFWPTHSIGREVYLHFPLEGYPPPWKQTIGGFWKTRAFPLEKPRSQLPCWLEGLYFFNHSAKL